ncbi:MAG: hypothetical protein JWL62_3760 [Hyphomicrobiales bacterium]|nr:hypothetical protein [Hyphomicrobiales bacterium]
MGTEARDNPCLLRLCSSRHSVDCYAAVKCPACAFICLPRSATGCSDCGISISWGFGSFGPCVRIAVDLAQRLSPPAFSPATNAASRRCAKSPRAVLKASAIAFSSAGPTIMFPWTENPLPLWSPAQRLHSLPVWAADCPSQVTRPICRAACSGSSANADLIASSGGAPCRNQSLTACQIVGSFVYRALDAGGT